MSQTTYSIASRLPSYTRSYFTPNANANISPKGYDWDSDTASAQLNALSVSQKKTLSTGIAIAASSAEGNAELKAAALVAVEAVGGIAKMFTDIDGKLRVLEAGQGRDWGQVVMWAVLNEMYRYLVSESAEVAIAIAEYAKSFEDVVLKFSANAALSVADRVKEIDRFIAESDEIKQAARRMEDQFQMLQDELSNFARQFARHARDLQTSAEATGAEQNQIQEICEDLARVDKAVKEIDSAMHEFEEVLESVGTESKLPIAGLVAFSIHPSSPWILGVGSAIGGVEIGAVTGLAIARNVAMEDKRKNEIKLSNLLEANETISKDEPDVIAARNIQETLNQETLAVIKEFADRILVMQKFWQVVENDASVVRLWLEDGADYASYPEYMKLSLMEGVQVYKAMAEYLMAFAEGVEPYKLVDNGALLVPVTKKE